MLRLQVQGEKTIFCSKSWAPNRRERETTDDRQRKRAATTTKTTRKMKKKPAHSMNERTMETISSNIKCGNLAELLHN